MLSPYLAGLRIKATHLLQWLKIQSGTNGNAKHEQQGENIVSKDKLEHSL